MEIIVQFLLLKMANNYLSLSIILYIISLSSLLSSYQILNDNDPFYWTYQKRLLNFAKYSFLPLFLILSLKSLALRQFVDRIFPISGKYYFHAHHNLQYTRPLVTVIIRLLLNRNFNNKS